MMRRCLGLAAALAVCSAAAAPNGTGGDGGSFGHWAVDEHGQPLYAYTLAQDSVAGARIANTHLLRGIYTWLNSLFPRNYGSKV